MENKETINSSRPDIIEEYSFTIDGGSNVDVREMADGKRLFRIDGGKWKEHKKTAEYSEDGRIVYLPFVTCTSEGVIINDPDTNKFINSKYAYVVVDPSKYITQTIWNN